MRLNIVTAALPIDDKIDGIFCANCWMPLHTKSITFLPAPTQSTRSHAVTNLSNITGIVDISSGICLMIPDTIVDSTSMPLLNTTGNRLVIEANNFELNNEGGILSGDIAGGKYIELTTGVLSAHNNGVEIFRLNASNGEGSLFLSSNDGNGSLSFISNTDVLIAGTNYAKASEIITTNSRLIIGGSDCYHIFIDLYGTRVMDIEDNQVTINADLYVNGTKIG